LNELETVFLRLGKIEAEGVAVIKFIVNNGGGDNTSCFDINTDKYIEVEEYQNNKSRDLVIGSEIFIPDKTNMWVVLNK